MTLMNIAQVRPVANTSLMIFSSCDKLFHIMKHRPSAAQSIVLENSGRSHGLCGDTRSEDSQNTDPGNSRRPPQRFFHLERHISWNK